MNWPIQTKGVRQSIQAGVSWYKANKVENLQLIDGEFTPSPNSELWYRFYEIESDTPFFAGRDGIKRYQLSEVEEERRKGYSWAGNYASKLLKAAN
jgi:PelA/Pel-15E family pectate lyase